MHKLVTSAVFHRWLFVVLFAIISAFGFYSYNQLSIEAYPDVADTAAQVITQFPGRATEEIEEQITIPLERALNGIPGLLMMRSKSTYGLSIVSMVFHDGIEDYWARQRIRERMADVDLPDGAKPGLDPLTSPIGEIYRYTLESDKRTIRELKEFQDWIVIPALKQVFGIIDVANFGGITTQYQVEINPNKLLQYNIPLQKVIKTIQDNNEDSGGSIIKRGDLQYVIRGIGLIRSLSDIGNIVVAGNKGIPVFLKDVGALKLGQIERNGILGKNEKNDEVQGVVLLLRNQNPSKVLENVHKKVAELNNDILPEDVKIVPYLDRTNLVNTTFETISHTLLMGMSLVIIVLILFLGSMKGALLVAVTIPLSLLIAFILMYFTNIPANLLSLGAIDFGIIVNGAIVMMESILKLREEHLDSELPEKSVGALAASVAKPIFFSTAIIITAYLPLFAFERVERKLFTPMAFTVGYALAGSLAVALLLIPGLAFFSYRRKQKIYQNRWLEKLTAFYEKSTGAIIKKPTMVLLPLILVFILSIIFTITVGKDFLPPLDEGSIWLQVQLPPGISLDRASVMANELRKETMKSPEVTYIVTQTGRSDEGNDPFTPSHLECCVGLKPYKDWPRGKTKQNLIDELAARYAAMPGYTVGFSQPMIDMVNDLIAGAHSELVIKIFGKNLTEMRALADKVVGIIRTLKGATDVAIDQEPPLPQLQVKVDREAAARYELNVSDIADLIEVAIGGKAIDRLFLGERKYDITVRFAEQFRGTPEAIGNLTLTTPNGTKIPVSQVAAVKLNTGESIITREMNRRHLTIKLNLRGRDLSSFLKEAQKKINDEIKYDKKNFQITWGGQFENQRRAYGRLAIIVPLALSLMFLLLYVEFGKLNQAALILIVVPLAMLGGMAALNIRGMTLNVSSAVGFIALFGVAIQNGVIMFSHLNNLLKQNIPLKEAVIRGTRERFRPILMTAIVATLGLLPASLATGIGSDVQRPLATVIVYGLTTATLITLFILPALYYLLEKRFGEKDVVIEGEDQV